LSTWSIGEVSIEGSAASPQGLSAKEIVDRTQPSALLSTEMNRSVLVEGLVSRWGVEIESTGAGFTREILTEALNKLRADHLMTASMATSPTGLLDVLTKALVRPESSLTAQPKAIGSTTQDLVFTPVAPCRLVDTRLAGGPWASGVTRSYVGYTATNFTPQGGSNSNCGIPNGVAALAIEAIALYPPADGWFFLWPSNLAHPANSTFNYGPALSVVAFGTILPVDGAASNGFKADSSQSVHVVVDVVGYFASPQGGIGTAQIADGAVTNAKLAVGSLPAALVTTTARNEISLAAGSTDSVLSPMCALTDTLISGGCINGSAGGVVLTDSYRSYDQWRCWYKNNEGVSRQIYAEAYCMTTPATAK
jgi:hypothetical protein